MWRRRDKQSYEDGMEFAKLVLMSAALPSKFCANAIESTRLGADISEKLSRGNDKPPTHGGWSPAYSAWKIILTPQVDSAENSCSGN